MIELRRRGGVTALLRAFAAEQPVLLSVVAVGEFWYGVERNRDPRGRADEAAYINGMLGILDVLPIAPEDARTYAVLRRRLDAAGTPIGPNDLWIAAQALTRGYAVATGNVREFARVPGLRVIG